MSREGLAEYVSFYEAMTPDSIGHFSAVMTEDACFKDPFNDVQGLDKIEAIFVHMFSSLTEVRFRVRHAAIAAHDENCALLSWQLTSKMNGKSWDVSGMSEIRFASDGRVSHHIDYWDAAQQFYERLPIVGSLLRVIRKRLQVS